MNARTRTSLVVAAPLVAVATLAAGLRVGAGSAFKAAIVHAAPPGRPYAEGDKRPFAFQLTTYLEDRGVREAIPLQDLAVVGRAVNASGEPLSPGGGGQESRWTGSSNHDGIAEIALAFGAPARFIRVEVTIAGESDPLAVGVVDMEQAPSPPSFTQAAWDEVVSVRPSKREGNLDVNVVVEGGRLVVGEPTSLWVEVAPPHGPAPRLDDEPHWQVWDLDFQLSVHATPELGVRFERETLENVAKPSRWVEFRAVALGQAASTGIEVTAKDGRHATWFGTLPTAPGAFSIRLPHQIFRDEPPVSALIVAPNPRTVVYVEIDDKEGRVLAAALPLAVLPGDPLPVAHVPIPPSLAQGKYWLVASGDPRGAEKLSGATITRSFEVYDGRRDRELDATRERQAAIRGTQAVPLAFPRWLAIDGIATRGAQNRARHRRGLFVGLFALGAAALLEVLLLTAAAREAKLVLAEAENENPERVTAKPPGGGLVVALLVALLGFAFLAALIVAKA